MAEQAWELAGGLVAANAALPINVEDVARWQGIKVEDADVELHVAAIFVRQPQSVTRVLGVNRALREGIQRYATAIGIWYACYAPAEPTVAVIGVLADDAPDREAEAFARALLLPEASVRAIIGRPVSLLEEGAIRRLAARSRVSISVVVRRLTELDLL